jgi:hypothetical protein
MPARKENAMTTRAISLAVVFILALAAVLGTGRQALAQSATSGAIQGVVTDAATGEALAGVTVVVTSPSLQQAQTTFTDDAGQYKVTNLPPGLYQVNFYYADVTVRRTAVPVSINKTTPGFVQMDTSAAGGEVIVIDAKPPAIDPTSTSNGVTIDQSYTKNLPVGRTFEDSLDAAPGPSGQDAGPSFSGSTALENQFVIDGVNTTELNKGGVGSSVVNEFIEQIEVVTGGYNAEYGRSTGAVINVATKSGSNQFRGSLFGYGSSSALSADSDTISVTQGSIAESGDLAYDTDFGFDLGGPIVKDRLWFYVGLAPHLTRTDLTRSVFTQTDRDMNGVPDGPLDLVDQETIGVSSTEYPFIGKLNFAVAPEHQGQIALIGNPLRYEDVVVNGAPSATRANVEELSTDLSAKWTSKFNDNKTEIELVGGWHRSTSDRNGQFLSGNTLARQNIHGGTLGAIARMANDSAAVIAACEDGTATDPYPMIDNCPNGDVYHMGGIGELADDRQSRYAGRLAVTQRVPATILGSHEIKAGIDVEDNRMATRREQSGDALFNVFADSYYTEVQRWVDLPTMPGEPGFTDICPVDYFDDKSCKNLTGETVFSETLNWSAFLRDSWQILPNLTINAGIRYEEQRIRNGAAEQDKINPLTGEEFGSNALVLDNMWAPRIGAIYDWTREGRSKVYAHYGRFYESVPLSLNRINLGGTKTLYQYFGSDQCPTDGPSCLNGGTPSSAWVGGVGNLVAPGTKGQFMDEISAGVEYELIQDVKVGISYHDRWMGRVIEDVSPDNGNTYVLANPGEWSADEEAKLEAEIEATTDPDERASLEHLLDVYRGIRIFDTPTRRYQALQATASSRIGERLFVQGSYTYSRAKGNFPGLYTPNSFVAPNITGQYDLVELVANRDGLAPQDRSHSFKVDAFYVWNLGTKGGALTTGTRFRAQSGTPVDAVAGSVAYGPDESFVLPRGIMGRTERDFSTDVHLGYARDLGNGMAIEVFADIFNLINRQSETFADSTYTFNAINPIVGGSYDDLLWGKTVDVDTGLENGTSPEVNRNFRNTEVRTDPIQGRLGARLTF